MEKFGEVYYRKVPLSLNIDFAANEPLHIKTEFRGKTYEYNGEMVEEAKSSPLSKERIIETLSKSKDTPFVFTDIKFNKYTPGFMRIASLNQARRQLIELISDKKDIKEIKTENYIEEGYNIEEKIIASAVNMDQVKAISEYKNIDLAVNPFIYDINVDGIDSFILKLPTVIKEEFETIINFIYKYKANIKGIITSNLGIIKRLQGEFKIYGDYKLNITNSASLSFVNSLGVTPMASLELNRKELSSLAYPYSYLIYGRAEVMISEYNIVKSVLGSSDSKIHILKDRKGEEFPLIIDKFGRTNIYNSHILNLIEYKDELIKFGSKVLRLDFLEEGYNETISVLESLNGEKSEGLWTYGHFKRGVL
jgi:U32 family peptidase